MTDKKNLYNFNEIRLVKAFLKKIVVSLFFPIKMATNVLICHFIEDIHNHSFISYLKVRNTGIS